MERLTHERVNGIKTGYWSAATNPVATALYVTSDGNVVRIPISFSSVSRGAT